MGFYYFSWKLSAAHSHTPHPESEWVSGDEVTGRHYLPHFIDRETEVLKAYQFCFRATQQICWGSQVLTAAQFVLSTQLRALLSSQRRGNEIKTKA